MKATKSKLATWVCSNCHCQNKTIKPLQSEVSTKGYWDSGKKCALCGHVNFVKVYPDGKTEVGKKTFLNEYADE